jgi:transcriptional regulator with XRE-family HTH domain
MSSSSFGQRLALYRRRRGLSQATLAGLIGRSESWISQVERGLRTVDRWSLLTDLASVLRIPMETLTGTLAVTPRVESAPSGLDSLEAFFTDHITLTASVDRSRASSPPVGERIRSAHRLYQAGCYEQLIGELPDILLAAEVNRPNSIGAMHDLVSAYVVAAKILTKVGSNTSVRVKIFEAGLVRVLLSRRFR